MGVFSRWPYANAHQLNLDWIIGEVKKMTGALDEVTALTQEVRALSQEINSKLDAQDATIAAALSNMTTQIQTYETETTAALNETINNRLTPLETNIAAAASDIINNAIAGGTLTVDAMVSDLLLDNANLYYEQQSADLAHPVSGYDYLMLVFDSYGENYSGDVNIHTFTRLVNTSAVVNKNNVVGDSFIDALMYDYVNNTETLYIANARVTCTESLKMVWKANLTNAPVISEFQQATTDPGRGLVLKQIFGLKTNVSI